MLHKSAPLVVWICTVLALSASVSALDRLITADEAFELAERQVEVSGGSASSWWFANIKRQGTVAYSSNNSYIWFRNVKDYGAKGDGIANDTAALQAAIAEGNRCRGQYTPKVACESSTTLPAMVYFPPGVYVVDSPIIMHYNTIVVGDAINMPTLKAHPKFLGIGLLDSNPYYSGGANWYANQNNFFRQVRNLVFDLTALPYNSNAAGIHWQVAQATSLQNLVFNMREGGGAKNQQMGIFMDNGSGGFMRDLIFNGGGIGFLVGNQQFTSTNLTFNRCNLAVFVNWDWLWSFKRTFINDCPTGFQIIEQPNPSLGSALISDAIFKNVTTAIITAYNCTVKPVSAGSVMLENIDFTGATNAVTSTNGSVLLAGGQKVESWTQGQVYSAHYGLKNFPKQGNVSCFVPTADNMCVQGKTNPPPIPAVLKDSKGMIVDRAKPNYDNYPLSAFVSTKSNGCIGDGVADDTDCLQKIIDKASPSQVIYIDHGAYMITNQLKIPPFRRIMGEGWPLIMVKSGTTLWQDMLNPVPVVIVGAKGETGWLEMQDIIFETIGTSPGAIMMEWNLAEDAQASAGMWDVHWRIGGTAGTQLQSYNCAKTPSILVTNDNLKTQCIATFLLLHITSTASLYMENNWGWVSDHELDLADHNQIDIYNGRGLLVESTLPVWIMGGSFEHSMFYNYQVANAKNVYMSHIQSETAYMQDNPNALKPFPVDSRYYDPDFSACSASNCYKTWGLRIYNSYYVFIYGAGLYSFFQNYDSSCLLTSTCQENAVSVEQSAATYIFGLYTIGASDMVQVDGTHLVPAGQNNNWFGSSLALFEYM